MRLLSKLMRESGQVDWRGRVRFIRHTTKLPFRGGQTPLLIEDSGQHYGSIGLSNDGVVAQSRVKQCVGPLENLSCRRSGRSSRRHSARGRVDSGRREPTYVLGQGIAARRQQCFRLSSESAISVDATDGRIGFGITEEDKIFAAFGTVKLKANRRASTSPIPCEPSRGIRS